MTEISSMGRIIAQQVVSSADTFGQGLGKSIANKGAGAWGSGPLWDAAILSMRTHAGGLAQNLENLKLLGGDVLAQLTPEARGQLDDQLRTIKMVMDEIHTDKGGSFVPQLEGFKSFGDDVASQVKEILRKADEAQASAATQSVQGTQLLDFGAIDVGTAPVTETVKVVEEAAASVQTMSVGGR